jgi:DNA repair exonuclease SbcCD nuclease subunit
MIICHLSDIHWRGLSRHEEYREVFSKFFSICREKSPDMIVVGGDIVHSKTQGISPELIESLNWWFTSLADIAPTHVILGNHDGLILNKSRQDAISPILSALNNPRISLYKKSGTYDSSHPDVKFCVFSCFDEEGWKDVKPAEGFINIALFHGAVRGALTDTEWEVGHEIDVDFFRSYDFAMLGDIHKVQFLDEDRRMAYPGSTIQQNYGETPEKGFLLWNIKSRDRFDVEFVQILNDKPFVTIDWAGSVQKTYESARAFPPTSRFRIRFTDSISNSDVSGIQDKLKSDLTPTEVMIKDETKRDNTHLFAGDKKTAEVSMKLILNDCVIEERWTVLDAARGGNGVGLFNYSPLLKNWGYYWATDTGATTSFRGSLIKPGEMRYVTERPLPNGKVRLRHWTLFANSDGTIRELSVGTEDGGTTWTTEYDLKWVRRK